MVRWAWRLMKTEDKYVPFSVLSLSSLFLLAGESLHQFPAVFSFSHLFCLCHSRAVFIGLSVHLQSLTCTDRSSGQSPGKRLNYSRRLRWRWKAPMFNLQPLTVCMSRQTVAGAWGFPAKVWSLLPVAGSTPQNEWAIKCYCVLEKVT